MPLKGARVLVVDDEFSNVRLIERVLEKAGVEQIRSTTDSREALKIFAEMEPDIVLLDLNMPFLDGFGVLEQLRSIILPDAYLPILVLTADVNTRTRERALAAGAHDFLTKPFDAIEVVQRVRNLVSTRFLHLQIQRQNASLEEQVRQRTTELERALQELKAAQQQVVQEERLRALGMMASGIVHDFNNALSVVIGFGELVLNDVEALKLPEVAQNVRAIVTAGLDGAQMVNRLREFYRPSESDEIHARVDVSKLVEQAVQLTRPKWKNQAEGEGRTIEVEMELHPAPPILADPTAIREVLTNLIFNAVDAMPAGGAITLRTAAVGDRVQVEVCDSGIGMSEEVRRRCLEPFFTTKGELGTGLGLAMVYGIVDRHHGRLEIDSVEGRGSTFRFSFPAAVHGSAEEAAAPQIYDQALHVLVVDDQPILAEVVAEFLQRDGHSVEQADSGRRALELISANGFDLMITDRAMPNLSGDQLAIQVREIAPECRIIMLTGFGQEANGVLGVDEVISKPISQSALRHAVFRVMSSSAHDLVQPGQ